MDELHIFLLPFLSPGHMIPMVGLAKLFAARPGVKATIVTTAGNRMSIENAIADSPRPVGLLTLPFPPSVPQNTTDLPIPSDFRSCPDFVEAFEALRGPFARLVDDHRPDCIVSDMLFPWSADVASDRGIPRLIFHGMGAFATIMLAVLPSRDPGDDGDGVLVVPGIPHRIELAKSLLIPRAASGSGQANDLFDRIARAYLKSHGTILNSFTEMEPGYREMFERRRWFVGPVARGSERVSNSDACMGWLDRKKPGSVVYVCFGSVAKFTYAEPREIAKGLQDCDHPFVWVVGTEEYLPEGLEERIVVGEGRGLVVRGWAPQTAILGHPAVGGFVTHCGWNSCLEGAAAGVPMVTWPQFADQFYNERLIVDVLRIGVPVGAKVLRASEEEKTFVMGEEVAKAVNEMMGAGVEAEERRRRATDMAVKAREAMDEGGSSYVDMSRLIQELMELRKAS